MSGPLNTAGWTGAMLVKFPCSRKQQHLVDTHTHIHTHTHTHNTHTLTHLLTHTHVHTHMSICTRTHAHASVHTRMEDPKDSVDYLVNNFP